MTKENTTTFADIFNKLSAIETTNLKDKKGQLDYISWAVAVREISKLYNFDYEVKMFDGKPFLKTEEGYMVFTKITIEGISKEMFLPVMDYRNKAIKEADMMDINKNIMRCVVKNFALFGFGISLYAGEDLPDENDAKKPQNKTKPSFNKEAWLKAVEKCKDDSDRLQKASLDIKKLEQTPDTKEVSDLIEKYLEMLLLDNVPDVAQND